MSIQEHTIVCSMITCQSCVKPWGGCWGTAGVEFNGTCFDIHSSPEVQDSSNSHSVPLIQQLSTEIICMLSV